MHPHGPSFALFADIRRATATAPDALLLQQRLAAGDLEEPWRLADGFLLHGRHIFVPAHDDLCHQVLLLAHSTATRVCRKPYIVSAPTSISPVIGPWSRTGCGLV